MCYIRNGCLGCCYRGAGKSLARPGRKQATGTKLKLLLNTQKKIRILSLQLGLRGSSDLRIGRKIATFQLFFKSGRAKDLSAPLYYSQPSYIPVSRTYIVRGAPDK